MPENSSQNQLAIAHALEQYKLLIGIVSELGVFQDVDWEQDEHILAQKEASDAFIALHLK